MTAIAISGGGVAETGGGSLTEAWWSNWATMGSGSS